MANNVASKETRRDLFGTRASCQNVLANALHPLLTAFAYTLMQRQREMVFAGTNLARATAAAVRVNLIKNGGRWCAIRAVNTSS
ncbi:transposase [Methylocaldum szegediense]|uniref:Transposase DDE domain-containing protein n=1 Tax=Methylocaldum szegediense TaxID=73780 RepID=A0ABM9I6W1_9GAMM|nr:transposase [Methylocaldum szegediense]CAI8929409.1 protein of unknown function [Methylocaldum szegediense]